MMNFGSHSIGEDDEYKKLVIRMNPPRVTVDNNTSKKATLVKVDSANKHGSLLEVVQVLIDLNLTIKRAYISSDGEWFMDVFHVVDQEGNKVYESEVIERIQQSLGPRACSFRSMRQSVDTQAASKHTSIELVGRDRPGLLSEIFAVLTDLKCNIVAAEVWTHNSRMASVIYITDEANGRPVDDFDRLAKIKNMLFYVLKGDWEKQSAKTNISLGETHTERRLHQMMCDDHDHYDREVCVVEKDEKGDKIKLVISVENCTERGYTVVYIRSKDRPKLLFDAVFTMTDMLYVVFHATIISEGPEAYQEYYIRRRDGFPVSSEGEKQRLIHCLEAAIKRRSTEGIRLELCSEDRVGLLSEVTRIFRENGLSVIRAEVSTRGSQALNVFYVTDASGSPVQRETIEAVRNEIGKTVLCVKDDIDSKVSSHENGRFSLCNLFRSRSERFLHNLGLMRSCS